MQIEAFQVGFVSDCRGAVINFFYRFVKLTAISAAATARLDCKIHEPPLKTETPRSVQWESGEQQTSMWFLQHSRGLCTPKALLLRYHLFSLILLLRRSLMKIPYFDLCPNWSHFHGHTSCSCMHYAMKNAVP